MRPFIAIASLDRVAVAAQSRRYARRRREVDVGLGVEDVGELVADDAARTRSEYLAARRALDRARSGIASAVDTVVVYECTPANGIGFAKLKISLDILVEHFRSTDERAAARSAG